MKILRNFKKFARFLIYKYENCKKFLEFKKKILVFLARARTLVLKLESSCCDYLDKAEHFILKTIHVAP